MVFQALVARKESIIKLLPGDVRWHRAAELSHNYQVNSPVLVEFASATSLAEALPVYRALMALDSKGFSAGGRRNPIQGGIARPSSVPRRLSQVV